MGRPSSVSYAQYVTAGESRCLLVATFTFIRDKDDDDADTKKLRGALASASSLSPDQKQIHH